jgi:hypothetical protein
MNRSGVIEYIGQMRRVVLNMFGKGASGLAARATGMLLAVGIGSVDVQPSFAGCGAYCEARQVRAICHHAIKIAGLKGPQRDAEFDKCKKDPLAYLQLEDFTEDALDSFD